MIIFGRWVVAVILVSALMLFSSGSCWVDFASKRAKLEYQRVPV
ncbi:hypothetical protein H206_05568 [Candidatus Electrothrix aarhusensis]|uniref:Uncharacterized protein n=1 Tax=Candidatus Electrothrix aarhusensis TaxID=1859131 RepID=A0A3S3QU70_9BACT|nr:hypothetical protein H206_05568 [Candidatus Electrothrix aarhusensis]